MFVGFTPSACLISGTGGGVTGLVFHGRVHVEWRVSSLPVSDLPPQELGAGQSLQYPGSLTVTWALTGTHTALGIQPLEGDGSP